MKKGQDVHNSSENKIIFSIRRKYFQAFIVVIICVKIISILSTERGVTGPKNEVHYSPTKRLREVDECLDTFS